MPVNCHGCGRFISEADAMEVRLNDSYNRDEYRYYGECCEALYTECEYCYEGVRMLRNPGYFIGHRQVARNAVSARQFQGARYHRATYHYDTGGHMHDRCQDAWEDENYDACSEGECDCCYDEYDDGPSREGESLTSCGQCGSARTFLDLDTEDFLCECEARTAHVAGHEVHGWPPLTVHLTNDSAAPEAEQDEVAA